MWKLLHRHEALVRVYGMALLGLLCTRAPPNDQRWYAKVRQVIGVNVLEHDKCGYRQRAKITRSRNWLIPHCESHGDSAALAKLLYQLNIALETAAPNVQWVEKLVISARELSVRLTAFTPFFEARHAFWAYLEHHFFTPWSTCVELRHIDIDAETLRLRNVILELATRGFISNEFTPQSKIALWFTKNPNGVIQELEQLHDGGAITIFPGSALYSLLKHARCWVTRDNAPINTRYERKIAGPARIANALDQVFKPYEDEIEHLRVLPTQEQVRARISLRKFEQDWQNRPPGPPSWELGMRRGLRYTIARRAGYRRYATPRYQPGVPSKPTEKASPLVTQAQSSIGATTNTQLFENQQASKPVSTRPRAPPPIQDEHSVQR